MKNLIDPFIYPAVSILCYCFRLSKNVKNGKRCSIDVPDSPHFSKQISLKGRKLSFTVFLFLGSSKNNQIMNQSTSFRIDNLA
jgi:hypothetical protein